MSSSGSRELKRAKKSIRAEVRALRDAIPPPERARASAEIQKRALAEIRGVAGARVVMAFWSFGSEVSTEALVASLVDEGYRVALPRLHEGDLEAMTYRPGDPVTETTFGAMEPAGGPPVSPEGIDVILTPGLAFDRRGHRVGYGGGFYDRFLRAARADALRLAVAFAVQVMEVIPAGSLDLPVDRIVTESETIICRPQRRGHPST